MKRLNVPTTKIIDSGLNGDESAILTVTFEPLYEFRLVVRSQVVNFVFNVLEKARVEINLVADCSLDFYCLLLGYLLIFLFFAFFGSKGFWLLLLLGFGELTIYRGIWVVF